jgi:prepilin-type N-terminal cleavage/methylation domain-containing protein
MRKSNSGFTLIELMVVVVLVMILALAIVPAFRDIINKSKYTEGSSAISALRTNIKVYQIDNGRLPGLDQGFVDDPATANGCSPSLTIANVNVGTVGNGDDIVQLLNSTTNKSWLLDASDASGNTPYSVVSNTACIGKSPLQKDLNIQPGDYAGKYFVNEDYQYMIINGGKGASEGTNTATGYAYAIAVTAGNGDRRPDLGTGYAVMEIYNPSWTPERLTLTWERYSPEKDAGRLYLQLVGDNSDYTSYGNVIPVPGWSILSDNSSGYLTSTNGIDSINTKLLKDNCKWSK